LVLRLTFTPDRLASLRNLVTLTVFDPGGFRGAAHRHDPDQRVIISGTEASPGFMPGAIQPGPWMVELDLHAVLPSLRGGLDYTLEVEAAAEEEQDLDIGEEVPEGESVELAAPGAASRARTSSETTDASPDGWLKGDLHLHSNHSDGRWSIVDMVEYVRGNALDFVALTDHNTVSGREELREALADARLNVVLIEAMELTTYWGHANALGVAEWIDWRVAGPDGKPQFIGGSQDALKTRLMSEAAAEVRSKGAVFVVNHPRSAGYPFCTGCRWEYGDETVTYASAIEVLNGHWPRKQNDKALELWDRWLNGGSRIPATAGSDSHGFTKQPGLLGFTYVHATRDQRSILEAVSAGRSYLSRGPSLIWLDPEPSEAIRPEATELTVQVGGLEGGGEMGNAMDVSLIAGGRRAVTERLTGNGEVHFRISADLDARSWYRVELRLAGRKELLALTNPLFPSRM